jgi:hypothetical protein
MWLRGPLRFLLESKLNLDQLSILKCKTISGLFDNLKNGDESDARFVWRLALTNHWLSKQ